MDKRIIDADKILEWMEGLRDQYEFSPLAHEAGRHWMLNIAIRKVKDGAFAPDPIPPTIKPGDKARHSDLGEVRVMGLPMVSVLKDNQEYEVYLSDLEVSHD